SAYPGESQHHHGRRAPADGPPAGPASRAPGLRAAAAAFTPRRPMGAAMNRFNSLRRPTLALVAVVGLGFARPAGADDSLPFRGRADAVITGAVPTPDGLLLTTSGTGRATHLGQ